MLKNFLGRKVALNAVTSLTLAGLIGAASSFIFWFISAHRAPISAVGHATVVVLVASVVNAVTSFGLTVGLLRAKARGALSRRSVLIAVGISFIGSIAASAVACAYWNSDSLHDAGLTRLGIFISVAILSGTLAVSTLLDTLASSSDQLYFAPLRNLGVLILRTLFVLIIPELTVPSLVLSFYAPLAISTALALPRYLSRTTFSQSKHGDVRTIVRESFGAWPASLVFSGIGLGLPLVVALVVGPGGGATFYLMWNVALLSNSLIGAATSLGLAKLSEEEKISSLGLNSHLMIWLSGVAVAGFGILAVLAFGSQYANLGLSAAPLVGLGFIPYGYLQYGVMGLRRQGRHGSAAIATSVVLVTMILLLLTAHSNELNVVALYWCVASSSGLIVQIFVQRAVR